MMHQVMKTVVTCLLCACCGASNAQHTASKACEYDRARLLALSEADFDQDMAGGWRALSMKAGCELAAADLLHDYRETHRKDATILFWHEAQLRAGAGQYPQAIALMAHARMPDSLDKAGWNYYVDATVAFLQRDRAALAAAHAQLAAVKPPVGDGSPPVVDGFVELRFADGSARKIRWPINIDVVEGLENCFDKPYNDAYNEACRVPGPATR